MQPQMQGVSNSVVRTLGSSTNQKNSATFNSSIPTHTLPVSASTEVNASLEEEFELDLKSLLK